MPSDTHTDTSVKKPAEPAMTFPPSKELAASAHINAEKYSQMYRSSMEEPDTFWAEAAKRLDWYKFPQKIQSGSFSDEDVRIKWFEDGELNVSVNCLDRHIASRGDQTAIIWEGDNPSEHRNITYRELLAETCRLANVMKKFGVKRGDRVTIYLPMIPEAVISMLACTRIGAVHSIVFGGFSPNSLRDRIQDCESTFIITADEGLRGGKHVPLKANTDKALEECPDVKTVLVYKRTGGEIDFKEGRDYWWHDYVPQQADTCEPERMNAEDPLFILYTSGSTGKPKGVLHTTGGYLLYAAMTHEYVFDYKEGEVFWCTADVGWVTGHSYIVYGPLANGAKSLVFEGIPNHPDWSRFWQVVDKHKVNIFYTAPTAIRALQRMGEGPVKRTSRASLRVLGSVGEPINSEAWLWYHNVVGEGRCPIVDTWWQTETGGHMITPIAGATTLKPGSATQPFFGVEPAIVDSTGKQLEGEAEGNLVINRSWPGMMRSLYNDHERFIQTYFTTFKGVYTTGDGARRDADGDYWITGRVDDVLNVSGHRLGTAEIESAINMNAQVAESAVVGYPHDLKGQGIYAFITLKENAEPSDQLRAEIVKQVRTIIGPIATPDIIQWAPGLPKTRSGKIMRRILRKIAANELDTLGDTSTLAEPAVVDELVKNRPVKGGH